MSFHEFGGDSLHRPKFVNDRLYYAIQVPVEISELVETILVCNRECHRGLYSLVFYVFGAEILDKSIDNVKLAINLCVS